MITPRTPPGTPADDDDPTGMRALLSSLPEPGPMPPELVQRISASLAHEQAARSTSETGADSPPPPVTSPVTPLRRRERRPLFPRILGGLAAAAAVVAVGALGVNLVTSGSADSATGGAASLGGRQESDAGGSDSEAPEPTDSATQSPSDPARSIAALVLATGTSYTDAGLADQADDLWESTRDRVAVSPDVVDPKEDVGDLGSTTGILTCLSALGLDDADRVVVDLATFGGAPAAVVVSSSGGVVSARAVPPQCGSGTPDTLASVAVP